MSNEEEKIEFQRVSKWIGVYPEYEDFAVSVYICEKRVWLRLHPYYTRAVFHYIYNRFHENYVSEFYIGYNEFLWISTSVADCGVLILHTYNAETGKEKKMFCMIHDPNEAPLDPYSEIPPEISLRLSGTSIYCAGKKGNLVELERNICRDYDDRIDLGDFLECFID